MLCSNPIGHSFSYNWEENGHIWIEIKWIQNVLVIAMYLEMYYLSPCHPCVVCCASGVVSLTCCLQSFGVYGKFSWIKTPCTCDDCGAITHCFCFGSSWFEVVQLVFACKWVHYYAHLIRAREIYTEEIYTTNVKIYKNWTREKQRFSVLRSYFQSSNVPNLYTWSFRS